MIGDRRTFSGVIALWCVILALFLLLCLTGCGSAWPSADSSGTEQEAHVIAETARFAAALGVNVRGELTDTVYSPAPGQVAAGWYDGGVAYYYRPWIVKQTLPVLTDVAAHEVCHAKEFFHGLAHWTCSATLATPTYPRPEK